MAHGAIISKALTTSKSSPSPSLVSLARGSGAVSIRPIKEFAQKLSPDHPLRIVLMGEPDEIGQGEYLVKLTVWLRLLPNDGH